MQSEEKPSDLLSFARDVLGPGAKDVTTERKEIDMNKVALIGYLGDAPTFAEAKKTKAPYARFSLATNIAYSDREGRRVQRTDWHRIVAFGPLAATLRRVGKGDLVAVHGRLKADTIEKDGERRTYVEIVAAEV